METTNIYTLTDPITNQIRYVGKANNVSQRYKAHLNRARKHQTHKKNWLELLRRKKVKPILDIIDVVPLDDWQFWETYWISQIKTWGFDLVNHTGGGDGATFANQTSFSKGNKPWNSGKGHEKICEICKKPFKVNPSMAHTRKTCGHTCGAILKKTNTKQTQFTKGQIPWNKGLQYTHKNER